MVNQHMLAALAIILDRLTHRPVVWALTGSLAHALQGVPLSPHDIDIQTDGPGAYAIDSLFADLRVVPVRYLVSAQIRSHLGQLRIGGVSVEIMGDVEQRLQDGSWESAPRLLDHRQVVRFGGKNVPVLSLTYEARAYDLMGRPDRADLLRAQIL